MAVRLDFDVQGGVVDGYGEDGIDCWWGGECGGGDTMLSELGAGYECWGFIISRFCRKILSC